MGAVWGYNIDNGKVELTIYVITGSNKGLGRPGRADAIMNNPKHKLMELQSSGMCSVLFWN